MRECGISQRVITRLLAWIQERWVLQKCWWLRPVFRTLGKSGLPNETAMSQFAPPLACLPPTWLPGGQAADSPRQRVWRQGSRPTCAWTRRGLPAPPCAPAPPGAVPRRLSPGSLPSGCRARQPPRADGTARACPHPLGRAAAAGG